MDIDENTVGIWYIQLSRRSDWMGSIRRDVSGAFILDYRFRYYKDDKAFDSEDEKHWYKVTSKELQTLLDNTRQLVGAMATVSGGEQWECMRGERTPKEFFEAFKALPFVHTKVEGEPA